MLLIVASSIVRLASSLYLPSLLVMGTELHMSEAALSFSISIFFIGYAAATLFVGPMVDTVGRKEMITIGAIVFIIGSILCAIATNSVWLYIGRIFQAVGASAIPIASRVLIREYCSDIDVIKVLGQLAALGGVVTIVAPALGGAITEHLSWRYNFIFLIVVAIAVLLYLLKELPRTQHRTPWQIKYILQNYFSIIKSPAFITIMLSLGIAFSLQGCFLVSTPFIFMKVYHLTPFQYGLTNIVLASSFFMGKYLATTFISSFNEYIASMLGATLTFSGGIFLYLCYSTNHLSMWLLLLAIFISASGFGTVLPIGIKAVMTIFQKNGGIVSGLHGFITLAMTAAGSLSFPAIRSALGISHTVLLASYMISIGATLLILLNFAKRYLNTGV